MTVGASIKLLHEAVGHVVTVETITGETFRGNLWHCEDTGNCHMKECLRIARNGQRNEVPEICVRGKSIRYVIVPDVLVHSPMAKRFSMKAKDLKKLPKVETEGPMQHGGKRFRR